LVRALTVENVNVRRATPQDEDSMRELWERLSAETTYDDLPSSSFEVEFLTDRIALIAEDGPLAVGTVYANLVNDDVAFVFGLYVVPEARRQGLARRLMLEVADAIRAAGRKHILLNVEAPNLPAQTFYERLGFRDHARMMHLEVETLIERRGDDRRLGAD
jgi:ribosomal protein S18 acetylase RimI-like enzyme